jgi:YHS domain-containing protein
MIEANTQQSRAAERNPVCGMEIDPAQAFTTRIVGEETFYCSCCAR